MQKLSRVEKKMRRRRFFFRFLLLIILIVSMSVLALNSDFFAINNIKVTGNSKLTKDNIISASSIKLGENIFKISTKLGNENLEKLSYVKDVKIKRKFPREIIINITERKEIIQIKEISSFILVDIEGYILDIVDTENDKLPQLRGLNTEYEKIGDNIFSLEKDNMGIELIKEGQAAKLLSKFKEINMENIGDVNIKLFNGITVAFGALDNVKYKLGLLDTILKDIEKNQRPCTMIVMNKGENPFIVVDD
ncbi:FtsQ-type POTRA domain-containing protein [Tissierella sp. MB52-C2]|uniref:cell division protein FtsQ/DivIB n=1 Tax=Tissierella sp. MB52-C2 TaxID=3070999 RepID=UPI00280A56A3|nr:FtsQ-type POTRA domain-containing protein [Tissierella sp. MB52-C2]WMM23354.1 FtsQ-type POTRA domain-containing protein [Tissierella sp. MB52-C2]